MAFSPDGQYLITVGTHEECQLIIWDVLSGVAVKNHGFSPELIIN
jgi:WD40 repeat protein